MFRFQIILTLYKHCFFIQNGGQFELVIYFRVKEALYRSWCGGNRLGDSGVRRLVETSAFVNPAGQLLLTRRGKTRIGGVGIVFELYIALL